MSKEGLSRGRLELLHGFRSFWFNVHGPAVCMNAPVYICLSCSDLNFHLALLSKRLHSVGHLINMRNAFNYSEPRGCPRGDLRHWASSACVRSAGGIKAESF